MADDILDELPLDVLLALAEAAADPSEAGRRRAAARAADAGFHLVCSSAPSSEDEDVGEPIPMEAAPDGVEALALHFGPERGQP